ncbi:hypothetical protein ACLB2K_036128 [Fragaria x ananassa]
MLEKKILAFDVKVTKEAQKLADELGVKIFVGDIIHEVIKAYMKNLKEEKEELAAADKEAVFPCIVKVGTPLCILQREDFVVIGRIETIKNRNRCVDMANKGNEVSIEIVGMNPSRHLKDEDELVSHISRRSIDATGMTHRWTGAGRRVED